MLEALTRPWRAHPELDGLSDAECRALIERRWRLDPPPRRAIATVSVSLGLCLAVLVGLLPPWPPASASGPAGEPGWVLSGAVSFAAGLGLAGGLIWLSEVLMRRRAIREIVAGARCPRCRHSLAGLPISDDSPRPEDRSRLRVRCPECGKRIRLVDHGWSARDLAPWEQRVLPRDYEVRVRR